MKNGYDQFFKQAKKNRPEPRPVSMPKQDLSQLPKLISRKKKIRKNETPVKALAALSAGLMIAVGGILYVDELDRFLSGYELGISGAIAAESTPAPAKEKKTEDASARTDQLAHPDMKGESPDSAGNKDWNEKDLSYLTKLQDRKKELDQREKDLAEVEKELQEQRKVLDKKIAELSRIRGEISKILQDRIEMDSEKVNKLVDFYSNMKPQQAAQVFAEINEDLAVEVLGRMKKSNAAAIMNLLKADKAQALSEKFAGYIRSEN